LLEYESKRPPFEDKTKKEVEFVNYDAGKHTPVFYGKMHEKINSVDVDLKTEFNSSHSHPACVGHTFVEPTKVQPTETKPELPNRDKCKTNNQQH